MDEKNQNSNKNNFISLRVPLEITINLGPLEPEANEVALGRNFRSLVPLNADFDETEKFDSSSNTLLKSALATFQDTVNSEYYNLVQDQQIRDEYYKMINFAADSQDLYHQLSKLISQTHKHQLKYQPAVHLYPDVDLQPDHTIHSIYSGIEYSPETLILDDFRIDRERGTRLRETLLTASDWGGETLTAELDLLEDSLPYNCEHVVPQSWFKKREPMKGDLHHLFACEITCNSFRSNIPYFDFDDYDGAASGKCGKRENGKFEPDGGKGAVARAVLYFLLRYPGEINRTNQEYTEDRLQVLFKWHKKFPPQEYEYHRNAVIFSKQGNRNPFIDFPELAEKVDFSLGLG